MELVYQHQSPVMEELLFALLSSPANRNLLSHESVENVCVCMCVVTDPRDVPVGISV